MKAAVLLGMLLAYEAPSATKAEEDAVWQTTLPYAEKVKRIEAIRSAQSQPPELRPAQKAANEAIASDPDYPVGGPMTDLAPAAPASQPAASFDGVRPGMPALDFLKAPRGPGLSPFGTKGAVRFADADWDVASTAEGGRLRVFTLKRATGVSVRSLQQNWWATQHALVSKYGESKEPATVQGVCLNSAYSTDKDKIYLLELGIKGCSWTSAWETAGLKIRHEVSGPWVSEMASTALKDGIVFVEERVVFEELARSADAPAAPKPNVAGDYYQGMPWGIPAANFVSWGAETYMASPGVDYALAERATVGELGALRIWSFIGDKLVGVTLVVDTDTGADPANDVFVAIIRQLAAKYGQPKKTEMLNPDLSVRPNLKGSWASWSLKHTSIQALVYREGLEWKVAIMYRDATKEALMDKRIEGDKSKKGNAIKKDL